MDHNETETEDEGGDQQSGVFAADKLRSLVGKIEALRTRKSEINDDLAAVMRDVKTSGFDVKATKIVLKRREKSKAENDALDALVALYQDALNEDADSTRH